MVARGNATDNTKHVGVATVELILFSCIIQVLPVITSDAGTLVSLVLTFLFHFDEGERA